MIKFQPVNARSYYEFLPPYDNSCGDIWLNLPTFGILNNDRTPGIVVSPACDISNFKTETITYLPIVPVKSYFSSIGFIPIVRRIILERFQSADVKTDLFWPDPGYLTPDLSKIDDELAHIENCLALPKTTKAQREHLPRASAGLRIVRACSLKKDSNLDDVSVLFGSNWNKIKRQLICNSYRPDLHFIPRDQNDNDDGFLTSHCLVLFRYPLTIQTEILTAAQSHRADQW